MKNEKTKNSSSTLISIRLPIYLYNDLKKIQSKYPKFSMSKLIVMATIKDIQRFL